MDNGAGSYRRFLAGDENGLAEIIREYRDGLIMFLNGFTNDIDAAEELAEDVFVKIAVRKPPFKEKASFKTWLYSIGKNEALQLSRKKKISYVPLDSLSEAASEYDAPETSCLKGERDRILHRCLASLKSEYHQVLWLFYFEELSAKEISTIMKKSVHGVETLLYRARKALKEELEKEGIENEDY